MAFFISPMGSFQRGMQILKNWYGGQLDASLDSGSGTKSPLKILQFSHDPRICEILCSVSVLHQAMVGFAYPCETGYADFVRVYGTAHLKACSMYSRKYLTSLYVYLDILSDYD